MPRRSAASCATRVSRSSARRPGRRVPTPTLPSKQRLCTLYRTPPPHARVICFDEFGPIEVRPYHGRAWRRVRHPARLRATYRRLHGTRQYLAAYAVQADRLMMRCYRRQRCREVLLFLKHIRSKDPVATRLSLVLDNFSPHTRPDVRDWAADHNVELVFTPTCASWLNRIEAIFAGVDISHSPTPTIPITSRPAGPSLPPSRGATGIEMPRQSTVARNTR